MSEDNSATFMTAMIVSSDQKPFNVIPSDNGDYPQIQSLLPAISKIKIKEFSLQSQMLPIRDLEPPRCDVTEALASIVEFNMRQKKTLSGKRGSSTSSFEIMITSSDGEGSGSEPSKSPSTRQVQVLESLLKDALVPNYLDHKFIFNLRSTADNNIQPIEALNLLYKHGIEEENY
jgi:hypothetical protein